MKPFFCKENMLNCVFFASVLIMVIIKSIINPNGLKQITFIMSILMLIWSTLTLVISILENINDSLTDEMWGIQEYCGYEQAKSFMETNFGTLGSFRELQRLKKRELKTIKQSNENSNLLNYCKLAQKRRIVRRWRRTFIFVLCVVMVSVLVYLFIANDVSWLNFESHYDFSIWTLVILLFEITIRKPLTQSIIGFVKKNKKSR